MRSSAPSPWRLLAWAVSLPIAAGCTAGVSFTPGGGGGGGSPPDDIDTGGGTQAGPEEVVVRFLNLSDVVVDTEFYATNEPLEDPDNDLFDPAFLVQRGIGLAATGLLEPGGDDEIVFPCTASTVLGTAGGKYRDADLGTLLGEGQDRVAEEGVFDCGNTIIFTYRGENGTYSTEPPVFDFTD